MFENIKSLRPHFHSLREIEGNVSLDIKLPLTWKHEEIIKPYRSLKFKVQDKNEKFTLMSLISNGTQEGYDVVFACASEIINHNKDKFNIPVLCMHSEFDLLTESFASKLFINKCNSQDKKIIIFKNSYNHNLFKDKKLLDTVKKNIYDWLEHHIKDNN